MTDVTDSQKLHTIKPNEHVILKFAQDKGSYILKVDYNQKLGGSRVHFTNLIGDPYACYYELKGRKLEIILNDDTEPEVPSNTEGGEEENEGIPSKPSILDPQEVQVQDTFSNTEINQYLERVWGISSSSMSTSQDNTIPPTTTSTSTTTIQQGDNSMYIDTNTAQRLTTADISLLRSQGLSGSQIIQHLMKNSITFNIKTSFAQEKYIKRKEKKYTKRYQILPCTPTTIIDSANYKNREKVCNMRYDTLAQCLSFSGVCAGSKILVVESMSGLITGAIAYRMRGKGQILSLYGGQQPHLDMVRQYNLTTEEINIIEVNIIIISDIYYMH
jgi:hypothetical protein